MKGIPYKGPRFVIEPADTLTNEVLNEGLDGVACDIRMGGS